MQMLPAMLLKRIGVYNYNYSAWKMGQKDEELKVSFNYIECSRPESSEEGERKEGTGPTLGLGYVCSRRSSLHFKAQLPPACVETCTHIAFSLNLFYFHTSVHTPLFKKKQCLLVFKYLSPCMCVYILTFF